VDVARASQTADGRSGDQRQRQVGRGSNRNFSQLVSTASDREKTGLSADRHGGWWFGLGLEIVRHLGSDGDLLKRSERERVRGSRFVVLIPTRLGASQGWPGRRTMVAGQPHDVIDVGWVGLCVD